MRWVLLNIIFPILLVLEFHYESMRETSLIRMLDGFTKGYILASGRGRLPDVLLCYYRDRPMMIRCTAFGFQGVCIGCGDPAFGSKPLRYCEYCSR